ncbi:MAG: ABC transporter permease [Candidatus Marinimicrobia bacterium]|nr:ABC transporter permease [Candidatus Neomarinimicrobiota bacterium]
MGYFNSFIIAVESLTKQKMRSALTLIGMIIGVASIIGIMTTMEAIQTYMEKSLSILGSTVFQVQKTPFMNVGPSERHKYRNRKNIKVEHADAIRDRAKKVANVGAEDWAFGKAIGYKKKTTEPVYLVSGATPEWSPNNGYFVEDGRFLTQTDVDYSRFVMVIGLEAVEALFPFKYPIGETVKFEGRNFEVVGVIEEQGNEMGRSRNNMLVIPLPVFQKIYGKEGSINITISAKSSELLNGAIDEIITIMRAVRKVAPGEENDFEVFNSESLISFFNDISRNLKIGSVLISFISLAVAGIGIMNIMMVSVTERTREIGIRKAIGARKKHILTQFLVEAVLLSLTGGLIGVIFGVVLGNVAASFMNLSVAIPWFWVVIGLLFCSFVGIVSGFWPALKASRLDPIESLRYE